MQAEEGTGLLCGTSARLFSRAVPASKPWRYESTTQAQGPQALFTVENEAKPVDEGPGQLPSLEDSTGVEAQGPFQGWQPLGQQQGRGLCLTHTGTGTQVAALPLAPKRLTAQ